MKRYGRWKSVSIELSEPLPELTSESGYEGIRAVFLWHGVALGHQQFFMEQLPLAAHHVANSAALAIATASGDYLSKEGFRSALPGLPAPPLRNPLGALQELLAIEQPMKLLTQTFLDRAASQPATTISVAVCTRERPVELARCLRSLLASSEQPHEIVVVDNAPQSDATREIVASFPGIRYHCEPRKGLSAARNTALAIASGDIVAFADDDVVVHADWMARIHRCFSDPKVMVATGLILPGELETPAQMIFEKDFQFFHQGYRTRHFDSQYFDALRTRGVQVWSIGAGANMAIRRKSFDRGHRFDTRLGPGVFGGCGEDSEFWYGVLASGWSCVYEPSAFVYHFHRKELSGLRRQVRQYMQGHVAALLMQFAKYGDFGNLRRLLLVLPAEYCILLLRLVATGFSLDNRILLSGVLGCFAGLRFAFSRKQQQAPAK